MWSAKTSFSAAVGTVLAAALLLTGCSAGDPATQAAVGEAQRVDGGEITIFAPTVGPYDPRSGHGFFARALVDGLVDRDPETGEIVPWLAESWEVSDDITEFTFHLRDDVTLSDGTPIDAQVVKANIDGGAVDAQRGYSSNTTVLFADYVGTTVVDDLTVTVTFSQGNNAFLPGLATTYLGIVHPDHFTASDEERKNGSVIGSGPYVVESFTEGSGIVFTRRDDYDQASEVADHQGPASIETVNVTFVDEPSVREGALLSGEADLIEGVAATRAGDIEAQGYTLSWGTQPGFALGLQFYWDRGLATQESVRKALQVGIDRQEISDLVTGSYAPPATSVITSKIEGHVDFSEEYLHYDPEAAAALLEADGWIAGADGIRVKDGERLSLSVTSWDWEYIKDSLTLVKEQLAEIGIELNITLNNSWSTEWAEGKYDLLLRMVTNSDADILRQEFSNEKALTGPGRYYTDSSVYLPEGVDLESVLQAQLTEPDHDKRLEYIEQAQQIVLENAFRIPIVENTFLNGIAAASSEVHGQRYNTFSELVLYDLWVGAGE